LAYLALGTNYSNLAQSGLAEANLNLNKALELRDRVSERERYRITGDYYSIAVADEQKTIQAYQLWAKSYPRDDLARLELGNEYMWLGRWEQALSETQESIRLERNDVIAYVNLAQIYLALNRLDDAETALDHALQRKLDAGSFRLAIYYIAFLRENAEAMKRHAEWSGVPADREAKTYYSLQSPIPRLTADISGTLEISPGGRWSLRYMLVPPKRRRPGRRTLRCGRQKSAIGNLRVERLLPRLR
jgi:tetratricopeptide (TPR) repeat protein